MDLRLLLTEFRDTATAAVFALLFLAAPADAATRTVCASGCTFTNAQLQTAIEATASGDILLLQEGFTYQGTFILPVKAGTTMGTIRTGVNSTGVVQPTSNYPTPGVRVSAAAATAFAKCQPTTNNAPCFRTVYPGETGSACPGGVPCVASYWTLLWIEAIPNTFAGSSLINLGSQDSAGSVPSGNIQDNASEEPHHLTIDTCYIRGDAFRGQGRGIFIGARDVIVKNSTIKDIKSVFDRQGIWSDNSTGNITITNNTIEGSGENVIFGGGVPHMARTVTVAASPAPTTTSATLSSAVADFAQVGDGFSIVVAGVKRYAHFATIAGANITFEALPAAPDVGGAVNYSVVPRNVTITKNHFFKPPAWKDPILATPTGSSAKASTTGGSLTAATYYYRVEAYAPVSEGQTARSTVAAQVSDAVASGSSGSVAISWNAVANATEYRVYGRTNATQDKYWVVTAPTTSFTDTGTAGTAGTPTAGIGTTWTAKNTFELKKLANATINGNVFEHSWPSGQTGYLLLFTVLNNSDAVDGNDSSVVRDITFTNNIVRHGNGVLQLSGRAADCDISDYTRNITISNNLFYDVGFPGFYGTSIDGSSNEVNTIVVGGCPSHAGTNYLTDQIGPMDVTFAHNTFINSTHNTSMVVFGLHNGVSGGGGIQGTAKNFIWRDNISHRANFGLRNVNAGGLFTEGAASFSQATSGSSSWSTKNVVATATCANYPGAPSATYCPNDATFQAQFVDYAGDNFRLAASSPFNNDGTDGTDIGANIDTIVALTAIAESGNDTGTAPTITTSALNAGHQWLAYTLSLAYSGGVDPVSFTLDAGSLAPGVTLSSSGVLSGTPLSLGTFGFTARVTDAAAATSTKALTLTVTTHESVITETLDRTPSEIRVSIADDLVTRFVERRERLVKAVTTSNLTIYRGARKNYVGTLAPVEDITGWTIVATVRARDAAGLATGPALLTINGTLTSPASGIFTIPFTAANTESLAVGTYIWDIWRTDGDNDEILMPPSTLTILPSVLKLAPQQ